MRCTAPIKAETEGLCEDADRLAVNGSHSSVQKAIFVNAGAEFTNRACATNVDPLWRAAELFNDPRMSKGVRFNSRPKPRHRLHPRCSPGL
jgi:hypothetical protein